MQKIYARKTTAKIVELKEAQAFIRENHSQETASSRTVIYSVALEFEGNLVAVAQFTSPRTARKQREYSTELLRLAFKRNTRVVGGASMLVQFYIDTFKPSDIFTYQDATGELSDVYEKAGFKFVSQDKKKEYLVAPGKTLSTGTRNEVLGVPYAVKYGPDRILKTSLGEVFDKETGKRKSNKRIFIEDLGWHIETAPGDKVYEWFNPNMTHYVYKITASDSDKYYYGVSHVKIGNANEQQCINDGYYGSGGVKFKNWKKNHENTLEKTIIKVCKRVAQAYVAEEELVGDSYATDPNCLNSIRGGRLLLPPRDNVTRFSMKNCNAHGLTKHTGDTCFTCAAQSRINVRICDIHGETKHSVDACATCTVEKQYRTDICDIHGETKFSKDNCVKCQAQDKYSLQDCPIHGETIHTGNSCSTCIAQSPVTVKNCHIHGEVKHQGANCSTCHISKTYYKSECPTHGESIFQGDKCMKCVMSANVSIKECPIHGEVKHFGDSCSTCSALAAVNTQLCDIHGETAHVGDTCASCRAEGSVVLKVCPIHGEVKHVGDKCYFCRSSSIVMDNCPDHGETAFSGGECMKCRSADARKIETCNVHGEVIHVFGVCSTCRSENAISVKNCDIHGETKHRGSACMSCNAEDVAHRNIHLADPRPYCRLCVAEFGIDPGEKNPAVMHEKVCPLCEKRFETLQPRQVFCSNPHLVNCAVCGKENSTTPRKGKIDYVCFKGKCRGLLKDVITAREAAASVQ